MAKYRGIKTPNYKPVYLSTMDDVLKDIKKAEMRQRAKAARHLVKVMKSKAPKKSGRLRKGIGYVNNENETKVGAGPPAQHAHLIEFGTTERKIVTIKGKELASPKSTGKMPARPFIFPTFAQEQGRVMEILSEEWI